jgi:capsular polysaccharide biosynthesis protein
MELGAYLAGARRWWLTILVATLVGGLAGFLLAGTITPTYETHTRLLVGPVDADFDQVRAADLLTETYADLATSDAVLGSAIAQLGLEDTTADLRDRVDSWVEASRIVGISVQADSAEGAAALADAVGAAMIQLVSDAGAPPAGTLQVVESAAVPVAPIGPMIPMIAILAAIAALVAALLVVAVLELLDDTVRSPSDLREVGGHPVLGVVPVDPGREPVERLVAADPASDAAGDYRALAAALPGPDPATGVLVMVVTDADEGRYSEEVVANLAAAVLARGVRVRLVDAREDRPIGDRLVTVLEDGAALPGSRDPGGRRGEPRLEIHSSLAASDLASLAGIGPERRLGAGDTNGEDRLVLVDIGDGRESMHGRRWTSLAGILAVVSPVGRARESGLRELLDRLAPVTAGPVGLIAAEPSRAAASAASAAAGITARPERFRPADSDADADGEEDYRSRASTRSS